MSIRSEDPEKLEAARAAINAIVAGFTQREFFVSEALIGAIMGRGGERIRCVRMVLWGRGKGAKQCQVVGQSMSIAVSWLLCVTRVCYGVLRVPASCKPTRTPPLTSSATFPTQTQT